MFLLDASTSAATPTQSDDGPQDSDNNDDALLPSTSGEGALLPLTCADDVDNILVLENSPLVGPGENKSDSLVTVTRKKRLGNPPQTRVQELLEELFPGERSRIHHHDICDAGCTFSRDEISQKREANKDKKKEKVFNHTWLCKADTAYCAASGYWWPVFVEGEGVYCILCKKHNAHSTQNKQEKFSLEPSVRFKSTALSGHLNSKTHSEVLQLEQTQRGSIFQREISNRKAAETKTIECVMCNLYFLMKQGLSNRKAAHLNELVALQGSNKIKYFQHRSQRVLKEMMLVLGVAVCKSFLSEAQRARCFGLLLDDLTDIAVQEQMICFIQYLDEKATKHTKFLFTTNLLSGET